MSEKVDVPIKDLSLDLHNYRTIRQPSEIEAVRAMITTRPDYFWALTSSLLDSGFLPTENVIVLKTAATERTVKEGNRRVAALKLIHGLLPIDDLAVPAEIQTAIANVSSQALKATKKVPCVVYEASEAAVVDRIVRLAHGKGEKAGRDQWNAVARARHNRDVGGSEPHLDLLERYLENGRNLTELQASRWAGDYNLTVLEEAMKKIAPRLGLKGPRAVADAYPAGTRYREAMESILHDIGMGLLTFPSLRAPGRDEIADRGIPVPPPTNTSSTGGAPGPSSTSKSSGKTSTAPAPPRKSRAVPINDPAAVTRALRGFTPRGKNREKVAALLIEATKLKIKDTPMAFCFVLRSMFELSANAYAQDNGLSRKLPDGREKPLAKLLAEIKNHMIGSGPTKDKDLERRLHGASQELASRTGILSVTSLNALIHHQSFSVAPISIAVMFGNVFPLLEEMNS